MRFARVVVIVVVALTFLGCSSGSSRSSVEPSAADPGTLLPRRETPPVPSPTVVSTTASASATAFLVYDANDDEVRAGIYATMRFRDPFTAEIDEDLGIRDAGDTEPLVYIGQDKEGTSNGDEEFAAMFLERVMDPDDQRALHPLEGGVFEWFRSHPRLRPVAGSELTFDVDGHPAHQLDLLPSHTVACGSFHQNLQCVLIGYGPAGDEPFAVFGGSRTRIVVVDHDGTPVLFEYQAADDTRFAGRSAVFDHWVRSVDFVQ
jgi:hypothetical protein